MYHFYGRVGLHKWYICMHRGIGFHALQSSSARVVWFSHGKPAKYRSRYYWTYPESKQPRRRGRAGHRFFLSIPLSISFFLSLLNFGRVGSATEKRLTADDGQAARAGDGYKDWGGGTSCGPSRSGIHVQKREHESTCVYTFTGCI